MSNHINQEINLTHTVAAIQAGCPDAEAQLYNLLSRGMRLLISRKLRPEDVDDVYHTAFMGVLAAIRADKVNNPEALIGFARIVVKRQITAKISVYVDERSHRISNSASDVPVYETPESQYIHDERRTHARRCMEQLKASDRQILYRFYVLEQSKEQICHDLKLSETSFRLAKSRAKTKVAHKHYSGISASAKLARPAIAA